MTGSPFHQCTLRESSALIRTYSKNLADCFSHERWFCPSWKLIHLETGQLWAPSVLEKIVSTIAFWLYFLWKGKQLYQKSSEECLVCQLIPIKFVRLTNTWLFGFVFSSLMLCYPYKLSVEAKIKHT